MAATDPSLPPSPPLGTLIGGGSLELVELLGQGGHGTTYRAFDARSLIPISYAVKCLPHVHASRSSRRRQSHLREIRLHKFASAHPNVVSLLHVLEDNDFTYIIMDYCDGGSLSAQMLNKRRYLGQDELVKQVFLQLLDAVEYSHSLGIYHRDLKPENVFCFDSGTRIAITNFGLATTAAFSEEFRISSAYYMSPECHGGQSAHNGSYSPQFNDVWSLGIILLNLLTGRSPWKSASLSDPTFSAYLQDPIRFLPTILPISDEVNAVLVHILDVHWRRRPTVTKIKECIKQIDDFYSNDVVFEGSIARCTRELSMDVGSDTGEPQQAEVVEAPKTNASISRWSSDLKYDSSVVFSTYSLGREAGRRPSVSNDEACGVEASMHSPFSLLRTRSQTSRSSQSTWSIPSPSASPSLDSLPLMPDDTGAALAYDRHGAPIKSDALLPMCTTMEAFTSPSARLFADFAETPARGYARYDMEEIGAEMRDELADSPFIQVYSTSQVTSSDRDSPILRGRHTLSGPFDPGAKSSKNTNGPNIMFSTSKWPSGNDDTERKSDADLSPEADHVVSLLKNKIGLRQLQDLERDQAQNYADILDASLGERTLCSQTRTQQLRCLQTLCGTFGILPSSFTLTDKLDGPGSMPFARGGYSHVYRMTYEGRPVAVKSLVVSTGGKENTQKIHRLLAREVVGWKWLRHENILPFVGVTPELAIVSDLMERGNIMEFIENHPRHNRFHLLMGAATGLEYLHSRGIVHGDLKGANILIDSECSARLADFGLATIIDESTTGSTTGGHEPRGTTRWMAPEMLLPELYGFSKDCQRRLPSTGTDTYALGMTVLEVLTGKRPFDDIKKEATVMLEVMRGKKPDRPPSGFSDALWNLLQAAWDAEYGSQPPTRPSIQTIFSQLKRDVNGWNQHIILSAPEQGDESRTPISTTVALVATPNAGPVPEPLCIAMLPNIPMTKDKVVRRIPSSPGLMDKSKLFCGPRRVVQKAVRYFRARGPIR